MGIQGIVAMVTRGHFTLEVQLARAVKGLVRFRVDELKPGQNIAHYLQGLNWCHVGQTKAKPLVKLCETGRLGLPYGTLAWGGDSPHG